MIKEYGVVNDAALQAYVNGVGQKLAAASHRAKLKWTFTVLDSPEVNAFALPGGYVYVTRGIMAYLDSEAELAGVLGHEIGHVTARHGAQQATRQATAGIGVGWRRSAARCSRWPPACPAWRRLPAGVAQAGAAGLIASYSRDQELQADQLGAEYLARSRYDPANMVDVIQVLQDQERYAAEAAKAAGRAAPVVAGLAGLAPQQRPAAAADPQPPRSAWPPTSRPAGPTRGATAICARWTGWASATGASRVWCAVASSSTNRWASPSPHRRDSASSTTASRCCWSTARATRHW